MVSVVNTQSILLQKLRKNKIPVFVISLGNLSFLNPIKILTLFLFFKKAGIKTLIINLSSDLKVAGIAGRLAGVKKVIYRRGSAIPIKNSPLNRFIFKYLVTDVVANSEETRRTILQNNPKLFDHSRIHIIYNGIDLDEFDKQKHLPKLSIENNEFIIGNCGRLSHEKGQHHLVELASLLKKSGKSFKILIAGEGKQEAELKRMAAAKNVEDKVIFLGFINNLTSFYEKIDLFVLTSKWEGFGFVLVEAMSYKKPVIAFDINSSAEIIIDNETGYLAERENVQDLFEKTLRLMNDKFLRESMGTKGKQRVEEMFTMKKALKQVEELITK
jgi:glycosyltransferase involved in cell wall biosynthesis